jgi:polysaccharide export outer membrane protein
MCRVSRRQWLVGIGVAFGAAACTSGRSGPPPAIPPPEESTTLGPGDVFNMAVVNEKDLPEEYQVASDGTVDLPYIHRIEVAGLEPQEIARKVRQELIDKKILQDPTVIVRVKEYRSKRVTVLGQVQKPGAFPLTPGLSLLEVISLAGGFTAIAKTDQVRLTRKNKEHPRTFVVDVEAIFDGDAPNVPLQAGDDIYVGERIF